MLTIVGCGNPNRRDDGVGVVVAQRLQSWLAERPIPGVQVFDCGTAGMEVMFGARGSTHLIVLDACTSGSPPGSVFCVPGDELAGDHEPVYSLHDFRWDHALAAGRKIFRADFPEQVEVFLVEAASLELGVGLSDEVARAADIVFDDVVTRIRSWAAMTAHRHHERSTPAQAVLP